MVSIIVDDQNEAITYLCPVSKQTVSGTYFNKTWTSITSSDCDNGWFEYTFDGIAVEIIATTSQITNYTIKLDDGTWVTQTGRGGYRSPVLSDGRHTLTYGANAPELLPTFDYLIVTPGPTTPLRGRTLVVDDTDPSIKYTGGWVTYPPKPLIFDFSTNVFRNTTHWSSSAGDTAQFQFTGTSVSVFGIVANLATERNFSASYTIRIDDGDRLLQSIPMGTLDGMPMTEFFHADVLAGAHTILINMTHASPSVALGLDFFAYNASFENLESMPNYGPSIDKSAISEKMLGAVVGGVVGAAVFVVIVIVAFLMWRRRHMDDRQHTRSHHVALSVDLGAASLSSVTELKYPSDFR